MLSDISLNCATYQYSNFTVLFYQRGKVPVTVLFTDRDALYKESTKTKGNIFVLGLARIELSFFIAAHMVPF